jgi:hypothetical protein
VGVDFWLRILQPHQPQPKDLTFLDLRGASLQPGMSMECCMRLAQIEQQTEDLHLKLDPMFER